MKQKQSKASLKMLSVIVPVFRCKTITRDLKSIEKNVNELNIPFEIICVVDGKIEEKDDTKARAKKAENKHIKVYSYPKNMGKGYAVRYGMARAKGGTIAFIDAGSDLNSKGIGMALEHMKWYNADIVIGSKRHKASKVNYPLKRRILSAIVQRATKLFFGLNVSDTQTGLKVFKRKVLEDILPRMVIKRWAFDLEMLSIAQRRGFIRIYESPIELIFNDQSNITYSSILNFAQDYLAIIYRMYILRYYNDQKKDIWEDDKKLKLKFCS
ncbi:glycosyltransferase [Patescibacteria group bacterium]|nr:glycosyltransferase [Patescibacteria group bacterium]